MLIGSRIQDILRSRGITQKKMSIDLHINYNTLNSYIHNRRLPDCETLLQIAHYLDTNVDYLLGNTPLRSYPEIPLSVEESYLLSNYRSMDCEKQRLFMELSLSFYAHSKKD